MSEAAIRAVVKSTLEGVSGIGAVHGYLRLTRSLATWLQMQRSSGVVNGWSITRTRVTQTRTTMPHLHRFHHYRIFGLYELDDENASEETLQALVDAILDEFKSVIQFSGTAFNSEPMQCESIDVDDFGDTTYHTVEMSISIEERCAYSA